jgi:hypothetical protein
MFSNVTEINNNAVEHAREYTEKKEHNYDKAKELILKFCRDNQLFIQKNIMGRGVLNLITYSIDPLRHANNLTNLLDETSEKTVYEGYIVMKTPVAHREFTIEVDNFPMVTVRWISRDLYSLLQKYITGNDKWMPPEIEMIELLQKMYNPYSERYLNKLIERVEENLERAKAIDGGSRPDFYSANAEVFEDSKFMLLGEHGWELSQGRKPTSGGIVSFLSEYGPKDTIRRLTNITTEPYNFRKYDLMLPSDERIEKYAVTHAGRTVAIFYNSLSYELIPYATFRKIRVASLLTILRFLYIDLYVFRIVQLRQKMSNSDYDGMASRTKKTIRRVIATKSSHWYVNEWAGVLRNEHRERIKAMLASTKRYYPYFPAQYKKSQGKYRTI